MSIVKEADIVHPFAVGGEKVNVRIGRQFFSGVVQCVASLAEVREAEEEFLKAHTVKQSVPARKQAENMRKDPKRPMRMEEGQSGQVRPKRAWKLDTAKSKQGRVSRPSKKKESAEPTGNILSVLRHDDIEFKSQVPSPLPSVVSHLPPVMPPSPPVMPPSPPVMPPSPPVMPPLSPVMPPSPPVMPPLKPVMPPSLPMVQLDVLEPAWEFDNLEIASWELDDWDPKLTSWQFSGLEVESGQSDNWESGTRQVPENSGTRSPAQLDDMSIDTSSEDATSLPSSIGPVGASLPIKVQYLEAQLEIMTSKYSNLQSRVERLESLHAIVSGQNEANITVQGRMTQKRTRRSSMQPKPTRLAPVQLPIRTETRSLTNDATVTTLLTIEEVISKYPHLQCTKNASRLAVKLAKEAVFGPNVMAQCTPLGNQLFKALPGDGLLAIKSAVKDASPTSRSNPGDFEKTWKTCQNSIGQACKHLRNM